LSKLQADSSAFEIHVKPYLDASNTDSWKHVLRILYVNGAVLSAHEDFKTPCLISQSGSVEKVEKAMDMLSGRAKTKIVPMIGHAAKIFMPKLLESLSGAAIFSDSNTDDSEVQRMKMIINIIPEIEREKQTLMGMMIDGAFTAADLIAVWFFRGLSDLRKNHIQSGMNDEDYETMIDELRKLDVVESKLQVSLCPECMNYELTVSGYPSSKSACPRCGCVLASQTLFLFKEPLGKLKSENSDLPIFISSYLKHKLSSSVSSGNIQIYPQAELADANETEKKGEGFKVEIDVYIPLFHIGMECKVLETPLAPMTTQRANGIVGELMKQLRKYVKAGVSEFFLVSNLPEANLRKVRKAFQISLQNSQLPLKDFQIIPGDIEALLGFLNGLAARIAKQMWENYTQSLKKAQEPIPLEEVHEVEESDEKGTEGQHA